MESVRTLQVTVGLPDKALCGNGTAHGFALSRLRKAQRQQASLCAYAALAPLPQTLAGPLFPTGRVVVDVLVRRDPVWSARRLDDDNLIRGLKATADGFTDAAVWADDRQVQWGAITWERAPFGQGSCVLTLTAEEVQP